MKYKVVDCHAHVFHDKIAEKATLQLKEYYKIPMCSNGSTQELFDKAHAAEVNHLVVHATATRADQVEKTNNFTKQLVDEQPDFLIGFGTIHPDYTDYKSELKRIKDMGLRGIKLHADFQGFDLDTDVMLPIYEEIVKLGLPILFHMGDRTMDHTHPRRLAHILDMFPDMVVIGAHMGGVFMWEESKKYLIGRNLYMDTSSTLFELDPKEMVSMMRAHGMDKILFGTDYPIADYDLEFGRILGLDLTEEERNKVFWQNAYRLFDIK